MRVGVVLLLVLVALLAPKVQAQALEEMGAGIQMDSRPTQPGPDSGEAERNAEAAADRRSPGFSLSLSNQAQTRTRPSVWENMVGPLVLGGAGLAGIGLGIYAVLPEQCAFRANDGVCLRGTEPNTPIGAGLLIAGSLAVGTAVLWYLINDAGSPEATQIQVSITPNGLWLSGAF